MKTKKLLVLVLLLLVAVVPAVEAAISFVPPAPGGGGGCNCDCPDEDVIANKVIEKLNKSGESSSSSFLRSIGRKGWESDADEYAETLSEVEKENSEPSYRTVNKTVLINGINVTITTVDKTLSLMDVPLDELTTGGVGEEYKGMVESANKIIGAIGIDTSVLTLREVPQLAACVAVSFTPPWEYLKNLHECVHEIIDAKLAKQGPEKTAEKIIEGKREEKIFIASESTTLLSRELNGTLTAQAFGMFYGTGDQWR